MTDMSALWRKSSYSDGSGGQCVEIGRSNAVLVRDSKDKATGPVLSVAPEGWAAFLDAVRASRRTTGPGCLP